jgi:DNA-binding GntR family transcriptional regulator
VTFEKLQQRTTLDTVVAVLSKAILEGALAPGSQLREAHIASELGVSRAPLREALSKLEKEGLVVKLPFRGAFVAEVGPKAVEEIATLRLRLEPFAVERSLTWLRTDGRPRFREVVGELKDAARAGDVPACIEAHLALHRLFYEAADHKLLMDLWNSWEWQLRLFLAVDMRDFSNPREVAQVHVRLQKVIERGSLAEITKAVTHHIHGASDASSEASSELLADEL